MKKKKKFKKSKKKAKKSKQLKQAESNFEKGENVEQTTVYVKQFGRNIGKYEKS